MNQIGYEERVVIYEKAQARFGLRAQALKALEELGEVSVELARVQNGLGSMEALAEEIADATIMLEQMRLLYDINEQVCRQMDAKILRLAGRLVE